MEGGIFEHRTADLTDAIGQNENPGPRDQLGKSNKLKAACVEASESKGLRNPRFGDGPFLRLDEIFGWNSARKCNLCSALPRSFRSFPASAPATSLVLTTVTFLVAAHLAPLQ
jgi:hypothetical protein